MANLVRVNGVLVPQHLLPDGTAYEELHGTNNGSFITGDEAHDAADDGNPLKVGGRASTSEPTAVADGDRVNAYFDEHGYQHTKAQLTGRKVKIRRVAFGDTADIAAGGTVEFTITPTAGYKARILGLYLAVSAVPAGATGDHSWVLYTEDHLKFRHAALTAVFSSGVGMRGNASRLVGSSTLEPSDEGVWTQHMERIRFTNDEPLVIRYANNSGAVQTNNPEGAVLIEEEPIDET